MTGAAVTAPVPGGGTQVASEASGGAPPGAGSIWTCTAKLASAVWAASPRPQSRWSSVSATRPVMLLAGLGNSTCSPSADAGPPAFWGSRNFQLTDGAEGGRPGGGRPWHRDDQRGSGEGDTGQPDAPGPAPPEAAHRPESGIQASASGPRAVFPASCAATAPGGSAVTATCTQWPLTCGCVRLKYWPRWRTTGPISLAATTFTTSGWSVQSVRVMTARAPSASRRVTAMAAERPVSAAVRVRRLRAGR